MKKTNSDLNFKLRENTNARKTCKIKDEICRKVYDARKIAK